MIGITGTKGKTTTAYMIRDIMNASGKKTGMIGTIYNTYGNKQIEATRTSPDRWRGAGSKGRLPGSSGNRSGP